ncbi:secondary thiamine-phosphate synthase enzyme YjbQ [Chloroflexota bacterium]
MIITETISVKTGGHSDIINITSEVEQQLADSGVSNGIVTLFIAGSTAGVTTIEYEPGLVSDFQAMWQRNVSQDIPYEHDRRWGDGNGYSHTRASLLGASLVIPFSDKKLILGNWQQIIIIDFDNRPRTRQIVVQIMGE